MLGEGVAAGGRASLSGSYVTSCSAIASRLTLTRLEAWKARAEKAVRGAAGCERPRGKVTVTALGLLLARLARDTTRPEAPTTGMVVTSRGCTSQGAPPGGKDAAGRV